ncbi:vWA domain-containing protein [Taylorella equigenitalis]|uniref:Putative exported protein n=1 Tax=Taylorella equigenitalis 14/56 TaxID=1091497 RepID=I7JIU8_9BURK|nr:vWA domain-containing protein [Taylorella equigenitalis]ASY30810.1 VWA domain-containing protein [Taylorella equigenitalis]ASY38111.1 VWA domain-containing protein [Taylorella equigenitalis]ASY42575.1 VWA domain-containing protein [Taylorella equigenitalis]KGK34140.1 serine/threonine protein kinase [Taylorella equigenitalis]KOS59427.1 serine/threonine protein kinase [Taylorella equigenitalis]
MKKILIAMIISTLGATFAQAAEPLLQDGKKTLYQRVLSTPECSITQTIGQKGKPVPAFSRYYIYEKKSENGAEWLNVGADPYGKTLGWLEESCTIPWNLQMTLTFTNPANRDRLLFFKNKEDLEAVMSAAKPADEYANIKKNLDTDGKSEKIISIEPKEPVDFQKNFYLLPILQGEEVMNNDGFYQRVLEVASVSKKEEKPKEPEPKPDPKAQPSKLTEFKAAVVFVIDSTISMDPYINKTREAVRELYKQIEKDDLLDQVKFGLVAFRSSTEAVPDLEYTSKMYVNPNEVKDGKDFMDKVASLKQAKVSSKEFNEDSYAGINQALNDINWNDFGARYIVLITDAGAIDGNNPLSSTGFGAQQLRQEAQHKGVAIYTLHLKTQAGSKNHQEAESQYNELSFNDYLNKSLYYPVNAGDVNEFSQKVSLLSKALSEQVKLAYTGEMSAGSSMSSESKNTTKPEEASEEDKMVEDSALLGKAMRLAYLGRTNNQKAPSFFKAWISDRDFSKPDIPTAEVRVLLSKEQLSDLSEVVKKISDAATQGLLAPDDMFKQLRSVAAAMGQDPEKIKEGTTTKIADLGLLGEYLDGLPYKSQISNIDEETWKNMGSLQQEKFIMDLQKKLRLYAKYNEDSSRWIPLNPDSDPKDHVYPVLLEALP